MITHEEAKMICNAYSGLVEISVSFQRNKIHLRNIKGFKDYITQQEKKDKLLELYQQKEIVGRTVGEDEKYFKILRQIQAIERELL